MGCVGDGLWRGVSAGVVGFHGSWAWGILGVRRWARAAYCMSWRRRVRTSGMGFIIHWIVWVYIIALRVTSFLPEETDSQELAIAN